MRETRFIARISSDLKFNWVLWCAADENKQVEQVETAYNAFGELDELDKKYSGKEGIRMVNHDYGDVFPWATPEYFIEEDNNFVIPEHLFEETKP